jgi:hypothetical protein
LVVVVVCQVMMRFSHEVVLLVEHSFIVRFRSRRDDRRSAALD